VAPRLHLGRNKHTVSGIVSADYLEERTRYLGRFRLDVHPGVRKRLENLVQGRNANSAIAEGRVSVQVPEMEASVKRL
jgi:hypothetical protein